MPWNSSFLTVTNKQDNSSLIFANWSPGTKEDQSPYIRVLIGAYCIVAVLAILVKYYNIKKRAITLALDYESALKSWAKLDPVSIQIKCFDILQDVRNRLELFPIKVS